MGLTKHNITLNAHIYTHVNYLFTSLSCTPLSKAYCTRAIAVSCERAFRLYFVLEANAKIWLVRVNLSKKPLCA